MGTEAVLEEIKHSYQRDYALQKQKVLMWWKATI